MGRGPQSTPTSPEHRARPPRQRPSAETSGAAWFGTIGFLLAGIILTPGNQLFMAANNTWMMTAAGPGAQGAVSGMLNLARNLGQITGASVMVMIFSTVGPMLAGSKESTATSAAIGFQVVLVLAAGLALTAVLVSARARRADDARPSYLSRS